MFCIFDTILNQNGSEKCFKEILFKIFDTSKIFWPIFLKVPSRALNLLPHYF